METIRESFERKHSRAMTPCEIQEIRMQGKELDYLTLRSKITAIFALILGFTPLLLFYLALYMGYGVDFANTKSIPVFARIVLGTSTIILLVLCFCLFSPIVEVILFKFSFSWKDWRKNILSLSSGHDDIFKLIKYLAISWVPLVLIGILLL